MSIVFSACFWSLVVGGGVLDWEFFLVLSWWPSAVGSEWGRNLWTLLSVMNVHVDRLLFPTAFRSVLVVGIPMDQCSKVRVSFMVPSGRTALICGSSFDIDGWGLDALGNLHSLVAGFLYLVKILRPYFDTCTFFCECYFTPGVTQHGNWDKGFLYIFEIIYLLCVIWQYVHFYLALIVRFNFIPGWYLCPYWVYFLIIATKIIHAQTILMWRQYLLSGLHVVGKYCGKTY